MSKRKNLIFEQCERKKVKLSPIYDVSLMQDVLEKEAVFFERPKINNDNIYIVSSLLSPTTTRIGLSELVRFTQAEYFDNVGNTLGISLNRDYFIPIILDLDHKQCEKNHDCVINNIATTIKEVSSGLRFILNTEKISVYVERRNCGLHMYVSNILVSLFVYERILEYLNQTTSFDYFFDDRLTRLPLPGQTKPNKTPYKGCNNIKWNMDKLRCLDYQYETTYKTLDDRTELCRFENSHDVIQWSNIIESNVCEEKIVTIGHVINVKNPPPFLSRLSKRTIVSKYRLFKEYCDDHRERFISCDAILMRHPLQDIISELQFLRILSRLGILIGNQLHVEIYPEIDENNVECFENIKYIFTLFRPETDSMFEIFATCAIIEYLHLSIERMSYEELFDQFLLVLGAFLPACDSIITIVERLRGHVQVICLEVCGELSPEYILQYITFFIFYKISSKDNLLAVLCNVLPMELDDNCRNDTLSTKLENLIYPFFFPCIKTHTSSDEYQFFYFNLKTFLKKTFAPGKKSNGPTSNSEMPLYLVSNLLHKSKRDIVQNSFLHYISRIPTVTIKMGKYVYFVNTDQGIFCNLTGTYSRHVPFLHFRDRTQTKKYCLYPDNGMFDNRSCLTYLGNASKFSIIVEKIKFFWIHDVLIPGLLNLSTLNLDHYSFKKILADLNRRILFHRPDITELKRLYLPVIKKYSISKSIIREALTKFKLDKLPKLKKAIDEDDTYDDFIGISPCDIYKEVYIHAHLLLNSTMSFDTDKLEIRNANVLAEPVEFLEFLDPILTCTMRYIMQLFVYDELTVIEFLKQLSMLYQPKNQLRRFLFLFGSTGTGKTVLMNLLSDIHGGSVCSVSSKLTSNGGSENHSSLTLNAATSYLTIIKEATFVDRNILKTLSGNDPIQLRSLHQDFQTIEPVSLVLCVANEYPKVTNADNAIRDRLGCFNFPCSFLNELRYINPLDNYIHEEALRTDLHPGLAHGLSNLLYLTYYHFTNENQPFVPKITNMKSVDTLKEFMVFNNRVYEYLEGAQLIERPGSLISEKEFKRSITQYINQLTTADKLTYRQFKSKFDVLFPKAKVNNYILGFNLSSSNMFKCKGMQFVVTYREEDTLEEHEIVKILNADETLSDIERKEDLVSFKREYIFHRRHDAGLYRGIKIII